jgi:lipoyl(octanoyl) transferase
MNIIKELNILDLACCSYEETWQLQRELHAKRVNGEIRDTLILVEHPPVYTLGKNADERHLVATEDFLRRRGIEVYRVDRGGDITYHGPGQLVGYPIFNLKEHRPSIGWFIATIEQILIDTLAKFEITAEHVPSLTGVWVGDQKIAAIGMRVARWVTMHGFALNVTTDLSNFGGIIPCGLTGKGVTRMIDLCPTVTLAAVKQEIISQFARHFGFNQIKSVEKVQPNKEL